MVFAAACVRALLVGVCIQDEGVRIRGLLMTRTLKWSEVESFSFGPLGVFPAVGIVHVKDGRPVPITAIAVGRVATRVARRQTEESSPSRTMRFAASAAPALRDHPTQTSTKCAAPDSDPARELPIAGSVHLKWAEIGSFFTRNAGLGLWDDRTIRRSERPVP